MNRNVAIHLNRWLAHAGKSQRVLAEHLRVSISLISQFANGRIRVSDDRLTRMAEFFGVSVAAFLDGPPKGSDAIDEIYESQVAKIKVAVCRGCQNYKTRFCSECKLERFFRLCTEVVLGAIPIDAAMKTASTMVEDCIADSNERHDRETGFMACGHGGRGQRHAAV